MHYVLNESVMCKNTKTNELIISVPGVDMLSVTEGQEELCEILAIFLEPCTFEEGFELINQKYYIDRAHFIEYFDILRFNNILKEVQLEQGEMSLSEYHLEKYKRQISSFHTLLGVERKDALRMQKKICNSCVCIVGVGGTGSHLALTLASIGVEQLVLVDFDKVELSNTARQVLYTENDIGKYKVDVAKERLQQYNSRLKTITYNVNIQNEGDMFFLKKHHIDLLILCADTPRGKIQYIVDNATQKASIPWFCYGPYQHSQVMIGPYIIPGETRSYSDLFAPDFIEENEQIKKINSKFVASICDPYNGFASQFASIEVLKILSGYRKTALRNCRYYIDTDDWRVEKVEYDGNKGSEGGY